MNIKKMKLASISPAEYNPRVDLQKGDYEYDKLKNSIDTYGFVVPLVVNERNRVLISGHQRLKVLLEEGIEETDVIAVDLDEKSEKLLNIAMNRIEGEWDYEKLEELFSEYDKNELAVTGYTAQEIDSLFAMNEAQRAEAEPEYEEEPEETEEEYDAAEEDAGDAEAPEDCPCTVYLSFEDKDAAEAWLKQEGIEKTFDRSQNVIVKMEGTKYGTATN